MGTSICAAREGIVGMVSSLFLTVSVINGIFVELASSFPAPV